MLNKLLISEVTSWMLAEPLKQNLLAQTTNSQIPTTVNITALTDTIKTLTDAAAAQTSADTGFMLMCSALVLLMTPGLAFFYGGFVRASNVVNTLLMSFVVMALVGISWILWGYSLAFAPGQPLIGGLQWLFLNGVGLEVSNYLQGSQPETVVSYAATIPHQTFMIYQAMFAIITPALISGAIVERVNFRAYCLFIVLWSTFMISCG